MTQLLILGSAILAQGPFTIDADNITATDAIYPKHVIDGYALVDTALPAGFTRAGYQWIAGALAIKPPNPPSASDITAFVKQVDTDADEVYAQAVGNRGPEYEDALADANAFKATGYTTPIPSSVQSWSTISGLALQAAADNVIATSAALKQAQASLRTARLTAKASGRAAATQGALDAARATWAVSLASIRTSLGM